MNKTGTCPECGEVLPVDAPAGLCPRCMWDCGATSADAGPKPQEIQTASSEGQRFGNYELLEEIARGGMGVVYRARQRSLGRLVAVKRIRGDRLAQAAEVQRFRREAAAAATLQHPHIVAIHEAGEVEGQHFYSMDFIEGRSLADIVREHPLPARQAAQYVKAISEAIQYAHERGILHRDLQPQKCVPGGQNREKPQQNGTWLLRVTYKTEFLAPLQLREP